MTERSGTGDLRVSTSTAFADIDLDSDLDLYVANDVRIVGDDLPECYRGRIQIYCGPGAYPGDSGSLFRNDGDLRFTDITDSMGVWTEEGRQLGVAFADYDDDGDPDLYVANDHEPNFLFRNDGSRFAEVGVTAGVAMSPDGAPEAGMGTDWADYDRDGRLDLGVCNFQWEPCRLLHNAGAGQFADHTAQSGLGGPTYQTLTFGTDFVDIDNDGYPDLFLANGHVEPNIEILDSAGPALCAARPALPEQARRHLHRRDRGERSDGVLRGRRTRLSRGRLRQRRRCRFVRVEQQPAPAPAQKRRRQPRQLDFSRARRQAEQSQRNRGGASLYSPMICDRWPRSGVGAATCLTTICVCTSASVAEQRWTAS